MYDTIVTLSLFIAALGAGLMAGVYFAFSGFVMRSFDQLQAARAADAMNAINAVILRSWFMPLFFASTLLYAALVAVALFDSSLSGRWLIIAAGLIYVIGMFLCTAARNVPLNNRLAATAGEPHASAATWAHYRLHWTRWNHLRSVCSLAAMGLSVYYLARFA